MSNLKDKSSGRFRIHYKKPFTIKSSCRFNKETGCIEIPKSEIEAYKNSPDYYKHCWREVVHMLMMMIPAKQIQEEHPELWEKALKHTELM